MIYKGKLEICASKIPPAGKAVSRCLLLCHLSTTEEELKTVNTVMCYRAACSLTVSSSTDVEQCVP